MGRADTQIKIRGFRIEPGEIGKRYWPHMLMSGACAVIARKDELRGVELVAYCRVCVEEPRSGGAAASSFQRFARFHGALGIYVPMTALPVTANGKLDRRALPEPVRERPPHLAQAFVEPRNVH